ncbi:MAG: hypothetical protein L0312_00175 [Acidobacteria bacterium]|nr:hypothetical protein [Acidobacteriota bacterium]
MSEANNEKIRELLRKAIPPVADRELKRDLWPQMLRRLAERPAQVPWLDWALLAILAIWFFFSPEAIPILLYHL